MGTYHYSLTMYIAAHLHIYTSKLEQDQLLVKFSLAKLHFQNIMD